MAEAAKTQNISMIFLRVTELSDQPFSDYRMGYGADDILHNKKIIIRESHAEFYSSSACSVI